MTDTPIFERMADFPPPAITNKPERTKRATAYEKRVAGMLNGAMRVCASNPATVADAAALIAHGDTLASKAGDLADADPRVRKAIDFITSGTENPYLAFTLAAVPLAAQIIRNHETKPNTDVKFNFRIPFTKRMIKIPFRLRLKNPVLRSVTEEPSALSKAIFGNPLIAESLRNSSIEVAWSPE